MLFSWTRQGEPDAPFLKSIFPLFFSSIRGQFLLKCLLWVKTPLGVLNILVIPDFFPLSV